MQKYQHISRMERLEISILLEKGYSFRQIAKALGRSASSISREIQRNKMKKAVAFTYHPKKAHHKAYVRRHNAKYQCLKIVNDGVLQDYIHQNLQKYQSPEMIAGNIKFHQPHLQNVSTKTIYKYIDSSYGQAFRIFLHKKKPWRKMRKKKKTTVNLIPGRIPIYERPEYINSREEALHYEIDTMLSGKNQSKYALVVLHERKSRYTKILLIPNLKPENMNKAILKLSENINIKSITWDNGIENRHHEKVAKKLGTKHFFCNPYHSWEKGSVENIIGRIRRFLPKKTDLAKVSQEKIQWIEDLLNNSMRKCLGFKTPFEIALQNNIIKQSSVALQG